MEQQMQSPQDPKILNKGSNNKSAWKALIITVLTLLLLIPINLIQSLVEERSDRQNQVTDELNKKWAAPQTLTGPMLMVPFVETTGAGKDLRQIKKWAYFLPDELNVNGSLLPEVRKRSLYQVNLFRAKVSFSGKFAPLSLEGLNIEKDKFIWSQARFVIGVSDIRGMTQKPNLIWEGKSIALGTDLPNSKIISEGIGSILSLDPTITSTFHIELDIKSSKHFYLQGWGNKSKVTLNSNWHAPNFEGMPDTVERFKDGFKATWQLNEIARPYPQQCKDTNIQFKENRIGLEFANANENYIMTERIVKYAVLFIALTFGVFFLIEMWQNVQIHPLQYGFVGIALVVFYILVLSVSEFVGFSWAYLISTGATILLLALYLASVFKKSKTTLGFIIGLVMLYGYIYFIIQLEEMSLIFGSVALFVVIAALMLSTRKVDWYKLGK